jgi:hypothetical protein
MSPIKARIGVTLSIGLLLLAAACSDTRKENVPFNSETGKHPANWIVDHGAAFLSDTGQCETCHGSDLRGGISAVSCFSASFNGMSCHASGPSGHPAGWNSPDQHGASAKAAPDASLMHGFQTCEQCHGADFTGGIVNTSCFTCHGIFAPHAFPWQSTSTRKHSTTNPNNAAVCGLCHLGARTPPSYVVLTVPVGCFDNTLCHGQIGHAAGWNSPAVHGAAAKASTGFSSCQGCHGDNFAGFGAAPTCLSTAVCHGLAVNAPHAAAPWFASVTSTMTHTTTVDDNAAVCGLCHLGARTPPSYVVLPPGTPVGCFDNTLCHASPTALGCVNCHNAAISSPTAQGIDALVTQRRAIVPEFQQTWSHKRSAAVSGTVTNQDCAVCHMEGNVADGSRNLTYHGNGYIDLRDPDTGSTIKQATWNNSPAGAGSYASGATDAQFVRFSRNLATDLESDANYATLGGIMVNQCLKCHDANGATNASAQVPGGSAEKPFNTTIAGAGYTGAGVTANGVLGGVTDINAAFDTANASYHPIRGKQNNSYTGTTRMNAPWNGIAKTGGNTTSWGYLISCWDCHAPAGATGVQTSTVTAHGAITTLRGNVWTNPSTLCTTCHIANVGSVTNGQHGAGSAFNSGTNSGMQTYINTQCHYCHSSSINAVRPTRAEDVHGVNRLPGTGTDARWPTGATETSRPYAFIRNTAAPLSLSNHRPLTATGELTTGSAQCSTSGPASPCSNSMGTYTPGGVY